MNISKVLKALPTGYADDAAGWDEDRLRAEVLKASATVQEVERERDADDKLNGAKEIVSDLSVPYRDALKAQKAKIGYALHLLAEAGKPVDTGRVAAAVADFAEKATANGTTVSIKVNGKPEVTITPEDAKRAARRLRGADGLAT